jgi:hypothetical protein
MVDQPLQAFSTPTSLSEFLPDSVSYGAVAEWVFYVVLAFWTLYTIIAIYHWLKYSHGSWVAYPAIATHLGISLVLIVFALYGVFKV